MTARTRADAADEAGVTLVELLVAMSIMGIIMVALASALVVGFQSTRDTTTRLDQSNAEQFASTYLTKDIQGADSITTAQPITSTCGGTVALEMRSRSDALAAASNVTVTYKVTAAGLVRQVCGPAPSTRTFGKGITALTATNTNPVSITVTSAANFDGSVKAYTWKLDVRRRPA